MASSTKNEDCRLGTGWSCPSQWLWLSLLARYLYRLQNRLVISKINQSSLRFRYLLRSMVVLRLNLNLRECIRHWFVHILHLILVKLCQILRRMRSILLCLVLRIRFLLVSKRRSPFPWAFVADRRSLRRIQILHFYLSKLMRILVQSAINWL